MVYIMSILLTILELEVFDETRLLLRDHRIEKTIVTKALVTFNSCVSERSVFITTKCKDGLIHVFRIENLYCP
jgi:hypothetical protein